MQSDELTLAGGHVEDGREIVTLVRWAVALGSRLFLVLVQSQVRVDLAVFHARLRKPEILEEDVCATFSYIIPVIAMSRIHVERQFALFNLQVPLENSYMHTPIRAYLPARISTAFLKRSPITLRIERLIFILAAQTHPLANRKVQLTTPTMQKF